MSHNITVQGGTSVRLPTAGKYCSQDIIITAEGGTPTPTQEKTVEVTENGAVEVIPDNGYALSKVTANVNVPSKAPNIQPLEITQNGTYTAPSGVDGYSPITVNVETGGGEPDPRAPYQRVEYIESAEEGTYPYIITDVYADNDVGAEVVASFPVMQDRIPMGSRLDSSSTRFYVTYPLSTSSCYYGFNIGATISCTTKVNTVYRLQTNFMNSRQASIYEANGTRKAFANFTQTLSKHTLPIAIFGYNSGASGSVTSKREYRFYSARITEGFDIIREYIPCYRKSDGVVGLYETFTKQFLTAETGAFAKGADIDW